MAVLISLTILAHSSGSNSKNDAPLGFIRPATRSPAEALTFACIFTINHWWLFGALQYRLLAGLMLFSVLTKRFRYRRTHTHMFFFCTGQSSQRSRLKPRNYILCVQYSVRQKSLNKYLTVWQKKKYNMCDFFVKLSKTSGSPWISTRKYRMFISDAWG